MTEDTPLDPKPKHRLDQPEHRLQGWVDRFLDRVVLPPCFITAVDQAGEETMNQRARAQGRGLKFGIPDHWVYQADPLVVVAIELKAGHGIVSSRQEDRIRALRKAGVHADAAWSIRDVLEIVRRAGIRLHGNADNIAHEITERWLASGEAAKTKKPMVRARVEKGGPRAVRVGNWSQRVR